VVLLSLSRNFGHQAALTAGLDYASGDAVAVLDADLQDPPELIPTMCQRLADGFEVVFAIRSSRQEGPGGWWGRGQGAGSSWDSSLSMRHMTR